MIDWKKEPYDTLKAWGRSKQSSDASKDSQIQYWSQMARSLRRRVKELEDQVEFLKNRYAKNK